MRIQRKLIINYLIKQNKTLRKKKTSQSFLNIMDKKKTMSAEDDISENLMDDTAPLRQSVGQTLYSANAFNNAKSQK